MHLLPLSLALALALALAIGGCGRRSPGESPGHDGEDDHAGHAIPAHKPRDFPAAVRSLRELERRLGGSPRDRKDVEVARDVANWLPELAADSDMPESRWDEVNARSAALVTAYEAILAGPTTGAGPGDGATALAGADEAVASLEKLLDASEPAWFGRAKP
jgi:hypothetical protein